MKSSRSQAKREFWVGQWLSNNPESHLTVDAVKQNFSTLITMAAMPGFSAEIPLGTPNISPAMIGDAIRDDLARHLGCAPSPLADSEFFRVIPPKNATQREITRILRVNLPDLN